MSTSSKSTTSSSSSGRQPSLDPYFNRKLNAAKRAEAPLNLQCRADHEFPNLLRATHGKDMEDGKHPFKYIRCRVCDRIFDDQCIASTILTPLPRALIYKGKVRKETAEWMVQICPECGLTHRGEKVWGSLYLDVRCQCKSLSYRSARAWPLYYINSPEPYRKDPNAAFVELKSKWVSLQTEKVLGKKKLEMRKILTAPKNPLYPTIVTTPPSPTFESRPKGPNYSMKQYTNDWLTPPIPHFMPYLELVPDDEIGAATPAIPSRKAAPVMPNLVSIKAECTLNHSPMARRPGARLHKKKA